MRHSVANLFFPAALSLLSTVAHSESWTRVANGETPYLNRAQDITIVPGGRVAAVGYLGDDNRSWDWVAEVYERATGKTVWTRRDCRGSARAYAVDSAKLDEDDSVVVVAGRVGGTYTVRAYRADSGRLVWEDKLTGIGNAYTVDAREGRANVTGTEVRFDTSRNRAALQIVTRSYELGSGTLLWEKRLLEGDAVRLTETDPIDVSMTKRWYAVATWVNEADWSGPVLQVTTNATGRVAFRRKFSPRLTINAVALMGRITLVGGHVETPWGKKARMWAFDARSRKLLWGWKASIARRADAEQSSIEDIVIKGGRFYMTVNRWIDSQCQDGRCRFGERRSTIKAGLARSGEPLWERNVGCSLRALSVNRRHIAATGVSTVDSSASPFICGVRLDRATGILTNQYERIPGDSYAVTQTASRTYVAGEFHTPYPTAVNYLVRSLHHVSAARR